MRRSIAAMKVALMDPKATLYAVLGVPPGGCDDAELKSARNAIAREFHPDRNDSGIAHDFTSRANAAYNTLADVAARKRYDASLMSTHGLCPVCDGKGFKLKQRGFKGTQRLSCLGCLGEGWMVLPPKQLKPTR